MKFKEKWQNHVWRHKMLRNVWLYVGLPVSIVWRDFIPWLVFMSWYANWVGHWSAEEGAEAQESS